MMNPLSRAAALALVSGLLGIGTEAGAQRHLSRRPVPKEQPQPFPEEALANGENGAVIVSGSLDTSGAFHPEGIAKSSGSSRLDAAALTAAAQWTFEPALDEAGMPVAIPLKLSLEYTKAFDDDYSCRQFVLDNEWHDRTRGRENRDELRIYKTLKGLFVVRHLRDGDRKTADFDAAWDGLAQTCRTTPQRSFRTVTSARLGL